MVNKKLSVIVPVYNVAPYLHKCVDSLIMQDYSNYEIILVDDGATDSCPAICDDYAAKHENIRVIHQENAGLSAARNAGIKVAKGEFVCFVDSDDYWEENVLGGLMAQMVQEKLDVLRFDYQNVNEQYEVFEPNKTPRYIDTKNDVVDGKTYLDTRMMYACYAWAFVLRREIVPLFTKGLHFEDVDWLPRMMLNANRVNATTTVVYKYLMRQGSITLTQGDKVKQLKNIEDRVIVIKNLTELSSQHKECKWLLRMRSNMVVGVLMSVSQNFYAKRYDYIKQLQVIGVFPLVVYNQNRTYVRRANIINMFGPRTYCALMRLRTKFN